ncbi:hypothetical protein SPRG_04814 [Saprolegnia parasitica CBS 223.65]|uniref:Uncharacterized protein n=1 Tax=Saprolegnia parasitica (strain CBS 223.65) TaxID=695850 RepID=A0A067CWK2_SAPPC|nr:hypothetical protein SPRG_04814 [Saprolegnia parasitica CBS 223.65]KDO30911.1 hypothetical protein SPRG_04814 [Saprolegnia parasitica CBS 223.65]|eukprot:XP_012198603.1 hypothetical protein SPRG_04814 [Saprolegnia parasitica CBS 223.65]
MTHCDRPTLTRFLAKAGALPQAQSCATDANMTVADATSAKVPTATQVQAIERSSNCRDWLTQLEALAGNETCIELQLLMRVSWDMATAYLKVASYPLADDACPPTQVQAAISSLFTNANLMPCLSVSGLYSTFAMRTPPSQGQLEQARTNRYCQGLYVDLQALATTFPNCNLDQQGVHMNVHALSNVSFDTVVDWGELAAAAVAANPGPLSLAAVTTPRPMFVLMPFLVMTVLCVAVLANARRGRWYASSSKDERMRLLGD